MRRCWASTWLSHTRAMPRTATATAESRATQTGLPRRWRKLPGGPRILLELTAGAGTSVGGSFEELASIMAAVAKPHRGRLGVCFDTCHAWVAGMDLQGDFEGVWQRAEDTFGVHRIELFHLNDAKTPFGSRLDRHENIGEGTMGLAPFRQLMNAERFRECPQDPGDAEGRRPGNGGPQEPGGSAGSSGRRIRGGGYGSRPPVAGNRPPAQAHLSLDKTESGIPNRAVLAFAQFAVYSNRAPGNSSLLRTKNADTPGQGGAPGPMPTRRVVAVMLLVAGLAGCGGGSATEPVPFAATALSVSPRSASLPFFGDTLSFSASITDRSGTAVVGTVTWSSGAPEVFSVTSSGFVTGLSDGIGILRATFGDLSDSAFVTVAPAVSQFVSRVEHDVEEDDLAGISAAIARDGEMLWARAFGWADREREIPAARETIYKVGSISKTITASLMAVLVDDGAVALDTPLEQLVPEIQTIANRPPSTPVEYPMLRHLANHTSGLPNRPDDPEANDGPISVWKTKLLAAIPTLRYRTRPGSDYHYSNVGYSLLGLALERAADRDFVEQVHARIFQPTGMTSSTYLVDASQQDRLATGYYNRPGRAVEIARHQDGGYTVPGGGAYSTVDDLVRLAAELMGRGGGLFSEVSRSQMFSVQTPGGGATGAGFGIFLSAEGDRLFAHHGGTVPGYRAYLIFEPATGLTIVLLRNSRWGRTDLPATGRWLISNLPGA